MKNTKRTWFSIGAVSVIAAAIIIAASVSNDNIIYLTPVAGDNWQQIQDAIDQQNNDPAKEIVLSIGAFHISKPLIYAKIVNGVYKQVTPKFRGAINAKNVPDDKLTMIVKDFGDGPGIGVQLGKGGYIKDFKLVGQYTKSTTFSQIALDTTSIAGWMQPGIRSNQTSPDCGIAIDFATDSTSYYGGYQPYPTLTKYNLVGMSRGGSTAVTFSGLAIQKNLVGFIITPSNQQNGEIIHLYDSEIEWCYTGYAICQAQSKQCEVKNFKCWGGVRYIFDNSSWGFRHGDGAGSPMIDGVNIAGINYQLFNIQNYAWQGKFNNVYGEGLFKFGMIGGNGGAMISNTEIGFQQSAPGCPSPDYYMYCNNVIHANCIYRIYKDQKKIRFPIDGNNQQFIGGQTTLPYMCSPRSDQHWNPRIVGLASMMANAICNTNDYDSMYWLTATYIHYDPATYNGYFTTNESQQRGNIASVKIGMPVVEYKFSLDHFIQQYDYNVGIISAISHDTVFLSNVGVGFAQGEYIVPQVNGFKVNSGWNLP